MLLKKKLKMLICILLFLGFLPISAIASDNVKFIVIADPHLTHPASEVPDMVKLHLHSVELLENTIKAINETSDLDFVLILGDLTSEAEAWNLDKFTQMIEEINVPVYIILGNHDQSRIKKPGKSLNAGVSRATVIWSLQGYGFAGPKPYWSLDPLPGLHLVGLDTNIIGDWGGHITESQLGWLEKDLEKNQDKLTVVTGHHSIIPFSHSEEEQPYWTGFYMDNGWELLDLFDRYENVSFYLSGHRHVSTRPVEHNGVYHIVHPSISSYPMRYTIYNLTDRYLEYEVLDVPASDEIWEIGRSNFLEKAGKFWRLWNLPDTPEGDKIYIEYYESNDTKHIRMPLRFNLANFKLRR